MSKKKSWKWHGKQNILLKLRPSHKNALEETLPIELYVLYTGPGEQIRQINCEMF